jgi:O-antigen/teichoic acid export membrane protein
MALLKSGKTISLGVMARGWSQVTALLIALLAARVLGKHDFGVYAIVNIFVIILQVLMYGGIYDYIIKNQGRDLDTDTCFWMNLGFSAIGTCLLAALAPILSAIMKSPAMMPLMLALAPSTLLAAAASWQEALLLRQGRLNTFYRISVTTDTLACLAGLGALLSGVGIWSFVVYRYAQLVFACSAYIIMVHQFPRLRWHAETAHDALSFASNIYVSKLVGTAASYSSDFLIGLLVNPAAAGAYRLGSRMVLGVSEVAYQPVYTIAWVHFSKTQSDERALQQEWRSLMLVLSVTVWPALACLALLSKSVVHILVGAGWEEAAPVVTIIAVARMCILFQIFLEPILGTRGRTADILKFNLSAAIGSVALLAVLARYGLLGAASAQLVTAVCLGICGIAVGLHFSKLPLRDLVQTLLPGAAATLAALAGASAVLFAPITIRSSVLHMAVIVAAGICAWGGTLFILFRMKTRPRRLAIPR